MSGYPAVQRLQSRGASRGVSRAVSAEIPRPPPLEIPALSLQSNKEQQPTAHFFRGAVHTGGTAATRRGLREQADCEDGSAASRHRSRRSMRAIPSKHAGGAARRQGDAGARAARERRTSADGRLGREVFHSGDNAECTPMHRENESAASWRTSSVDAYARLETGRQQKEDGPQTKHLLQREIEARSQRIANLRRLRKEDSMSDANVVQPWRKLIVCCARLPFTVILDEETGKLSVERDPFEANLAEILAAEISDGKVPASAVQSDNVILVGAPVVRRAADRSIISSFDDGLQHELVNILQVRHRNVVTVPVFLPPGRDRFADQVIFPLFHYTPPSMETGVGLYDWDGYELVNEHFRDAVLQIATRGDLVLINDYPLMLLPKFLRKERPDMCIGFYMHCVFPSSEVYRILPQREQLLRGVLSANIIGFHNFQYVRHFLTASTRILGCECTASGIEACEDAEGTSTKVIAVPLGIDLEPYQFIFHQEETKARMLELEQTFAGKYILVAVDRLEEKEGIPHKIMAFHRFLQKLPSWAERVVFVQIVEPPPASAESEDETGEDLQKLLQQVYQMGGEVNSAFGSIGHLPFHFLCQSFTRVDLTALMVKANVFLDTPLRDTLSKEAHEFVWCQEDNEQCGVLILSEFSGSAQSLRAAALCVNPWDTRAFADAIQEALEMEYRDRRELNVYGQKHVFDHTFRRWAGNFLDEIVTAEKECEDERLQIPPALDQDMAVAAIRKASRRILVWGFSGTLLPSKSRMKTQILTKLTPAQLGNLQAIAEEPNTHLIILSSLERHVLEEAVGNLPCWIIADGGVCYREPEGSWCDTMEQLDLEWLGPVKEIMEYFAARTPGSNVRETNSSVSWHYQRTQGDHAAIQSKALLIHLWAGPLLSAPAEVVVGNDSVSVRPTGVSKASQLEKILNKICCEEGTTAPSQKWLSGDSVVSCVCDLITKDEDVFVTMQKFFESDSSSMAGASAGWHETYRPFTSGGTVGTIRGLSSSDSLGGITESWLGGGGDWRSEEAHLETNSQSLGAYMSRLALGRRENLDSLEDGPFGLHKPTEDGGHLIKKVPSEPELPIVHDDRYESAEDASERQEFKELAVPGRITVLTCTVRRKPTRASYHLSDTHDVSFLIARLAREIRQAKQAHDADVQSDAAEERKE
eukprot:TRINITY_DN5963_c0_g1_i1.p1 TRINITY_DN5963_c0_g1~~TRINITY_DN5963_c0_g1_i1.p1  ORF type:complete len:1159 (-),score=194.54 TRINITY_DN5963_c0_g1_i1:60-3536(-)